MICEDFKNEDTTFLRSWTRNDVCPEEDHSDTDKEGNMEQEVCNRENGDAWLLVQPSWKCLTEDENVLPEL
jgi:hypothetical protein